MIRLAASTKGIPDLPHFLRYALPKIRRWVTRSIITTALLTFSNAAAHAAELKLVFPDLKMQGQVSVAVFDRSQQWTARSSPVWSKLVDVSANSLELVCDLPPGNYAVMAYHDRNANGRLDTLPVGLPTEPYGFSNNSRGMFGPPSWRQAVFALPDAGSAQVISLR